MTTFVGQLIFDSAVLLVFAIPLIVIAWRRERIAHARNFLIAGFIVAILSATIAFTSQQLVERCFTAGNRGCQDYGSSGFRMLLMGGYIVVALIEASLVARD